MNRIQDAANAVRHPVVSVCVSDTSNPVANWLDRLASRLRPSLNTAELVQTLLACRSSDLVTHAHAVVTPDGVDAVVTLTTGRGLTQRRHVLPVNDVAPMRLQLMAMAGFDPETLMVCALLAQAVVEATARIAHVHRCQRAGTAIIIPLRASARTVH